MKRLVFVIAIASALTAGALAQEQIPPARKSAPSPVPQTEEERIGYALGRDIGRMLKAKGTEVDLTFLARGIRDVMTGAKPAMTDQEIQQTLQAAQRDAMNRIVSRNKAEGEKFLAANAKKEGVQTTKSGLQYKILKEGKGPSPRLTDVVRTHYHGTFINGEVFDSSVERKEPAEFPVNGVIAGWTEALQLMKVGSKWQLFVPSDLAYGERGQSEIQPNTMLIFEVELLDILKAPPIRK